MTNVRAAYDGYLLSQRARNVSKAYLSLLELTRDYWLLHVPDGELSAVTPDAIREWLTWLCDEDGKSLSSASVSVHYRNFKAFLNWCLLEEHLVVSPMAKVRRPKVEETLPDVLTEHEVRVLLKRVRESGRPNAWRNYCIHLFFVDTGVRLEELTRLSLADVNFTQGYAKVFGKGRKERIVPLGAKLRRDLHRYILSHRYAVDGETALFTSDDGYRLDRGGVRTMVVRDQHEYVSRELRKYGPHLERHTAATIRLRETGDLQRTSQILGHKSLDTTQRYLHLVRGDYLSDGSPMDAVLSDSTGKRNGAH